MSCCRNLAVFYALIYEHTYIIFVSQCLGGEEEGNCGDKEGAEACTSSGGTCSTYIDGYFLEAIICTCIGKINIIGAKILGDSICPSLSHGWGPLVLPILMDTSLKLSFVLL